LLVDDEPAILRALQDLLEEKFVVHVAKSAAEALEMLCSLPIAVLITDQRMPKMTGDQLLTRAAELSKATRVLLTGYGDLDSLQSAVNSGGLYAYLVKPWNEVELLFTVARAAEHYETVRQLEHERFLYRQLMDHLPYGIFFKDQQGGYLRANRAAATLMGVAEPERLQGLSDSDLLEPEDAERCRQEDGTVLREGRALLDVLHSRRDATGDLRWYSTSKFPIATGLVGISREVTDRLALEQELSWARQRLARAQEEQEQAREVSKEEERQYLGRELHDSVSQALYGIGLGLRTALQQLDRDPAAVRAPLEFSLSLLDSALAEMRGLLLKLRPQSLERSTLAEALESQLEGLRARHRLKIEFRATSPEPSALSLEVKHAVFRIAMEAVHNVAKHAQAESLRVRLEFLESEVELAVDDDGAGFDTQRNYPGHHGLSSMLERAKAVGGTLSLSSQKGAGTQVICRVPLHRDQACSTPMGPASLELLALGELVLGTNGHP
jgi:PAS domain S-box-containing protein